MTRATWISSAALGLGIAVAVFTELWPYVLVAAPGIVYAAFLLAEPRVGLLLWLLLAPVANTYANVSFPVGIPDITFGRVSITVVMVALLVRKRLTGHRLAPWGGVELSTIALLTVMAMDQLLRSGDQMSETLRNFDSRVTPFLIFLAARNLYRGRNDLRHVGYIVAGVGCYLAFHGAYQYFTYSPAALSGLDPGAVTQLGHQASGRAVGPFSNSVEYGSVVAIGLISTLLMVLHATSGALRLVLATALAPMAAGVILSSTRAVWLGCYVALLTMAVLDRKRRAALLVSVGAATLVAAALALTLSDAAFLRQRTSDAGAIYSRLRMYEIAARMAIKEPLFGYGSGPGSRVAARSESHEMGGLDADWAAGQFHNVYVMTLIEWGIGGLIAYLAVHTFLVKGALQLRRLTHTGSLAHHFAGFFLATTAIYMVQGLFADTPPFLYLTGIYFFLGGVLYAQLDATVASRVARMPVTRGSVHAWNISMGRSPSAGEASQA